MIVIGTEVLAVDSLGALHRAIVRIGFPRSRGSFLTLKFGEKNRSRVSRRTVSLILSTIKILS